MVSIEISNPEKKIFAHYMKKNYVEYYEEIASFMLPHIKNRPLSLYRFPDGADKKGFFQKNTSSYFPKWIDHKLIQHKDGAVDYVVCQDKKSLLYIASQVTEIHPWISTVDKLEHPDKMIFDLDPSDQDFDLLKKIVKKLGKLLSDIGLEPYLMTTGKKGYHITVPIKPEQKNDSVRGFALKVSQVIALDDPDNVTTQLVKYKRKKSELLNTAQSEKK